MALRPIWANILVLPIEIKKSEIIEVPEDDKEAPGRGEVLAIGEGRQDRDGKVHDLAVKKGDIVVFRKYSATKWDDHGTDVLFLEESDILAIDEPDAPKDAE